MREIASGCGQQRQPSGWSGQAQGLLFEPVHHSGNSTASDEEVERIAALVDQLYGQPYPRQAGEW